MELIEGQCASFTSILSPLISFPCDYGQGLHKETGQTCLFQPRDSFHRGGQIPPVVWHCDRNCISFFCFFLFWKAMIKGLSKHCNTIFSFKRMAVRSRMCKDRPASVTLQHYSFTLLAIPVASTQALPFTSIHRLNHQYSIYALNTLHNETFICYLHTQDKIPSSSVGGLHKTSVYIA